ncbi:hypothetical protein ACQ4PT_068572 [Festuca glaucescens]
MAQIRVQRHDTLKHIAAARGADAHPISQHQELVSCKKVSEGTTQAEKDQPDQEAELMRAEIKRLSFWRLAAVRRAPFWFVVSGVENDGISMMGDEIDYMKEPLQRKMQEQPHDADTAVALLSLFLESNLNEIKLGEGDTQVEMYCAAKSYIFEVSMGILQVFLNFRL